MKNEMEKNRSKSGKTKDPAHKNVILIGYMGCGKSTIGCRLSYRLRMPFLDTDKQIEIRQNREISEIFALQGEQAFRDMETECLRHLLSDKCKYVVAVGGGLPIREENRELLKQLGTCIYLKATPDTIYERLKNDTSRPLLQRDDPYAVICDMLKERQGIYESCADMVLPVDDKTIEQLVKEVEEMIRT